MTHDTVDRSKDWSFVPRSLAARGISDDLLRRIRRWQPEDPARMIAAVLEWAAQLVPQGLRLPSIERFVRDPLGLPTRSPQIEQRRRQEAHSPSWRAAAAEELYALADSVRAGVERELVEPAHRDACLFAERALRQSHLLALLEAAERDPQSLHSALPEGDRERVRDLVLGRSQRLLDDTVARWDRFVVKLDDWGYDEYASSLSLRDMFAMAEAAVSPEAAVTLRDRYAAIDRRYLEQTQPIGHSLHDGPGRWSPRGWWYYRAPRTIDADFARSAGITAPPGQSQQSPSE